MNYRSTWVNLFTFSFPQFSLLVFAQDRKNIFPQFLSLSPFSPLVLLFCLIPHSVFLLDLRQERRIPAYVLDCALMDGSQRFISDDDFES